MLELELSKLSLELTSCHCKTEVTSIHHGQAVGAIRLHFAGSSLHVMWKNNETDNLSFDFFCCN